MHNETASRPEQATAAAGGQQRQSNRVRPVFPRPVVLPALLATADSGTIQRVMSHLQTSAGNAAIQRLMSDRQGQRKQSHVSTPKPSCPESEVSHSTLLGTDYALGP